MDNIKEIVKLADSYESKIIKTAGYLGLYCAPALRNSKLNIKLNNDITKIIKKAEIGSLIANTLGIKSEKSGNTWNVQTYIIWINQSLFSDPKVGKIIFNITEQFKQNCNKVCINALMKMDPTEKAKAPNSMTEEIYWNADASNFVEISVG